MPYTTSREWTEYFQRHERSLAPVPWDFGAGLTPAEHRAVVRSLQAWQLGETSEGHHLREAARRYSLAIGDDDFPAAVDCFIREEQRHGAWLGRFLDLAGVPRLQRNWGDSIFRLFRYARPSMELWTTVVIAVEIMAMVYYAAVHRATRSLLLRHLCLQILLDEVPHLRFQYERLAMIHAGRSRTGLWLTYAAQRVLFTGVVLAVWVGHHRTLRAGGHSFVSYWGVSWRRMNFVWLRMRPQPARVAAPALVPARASTT